MSFIAKHLPASKVDSFESYLRSRFFLSEEATGEVALILVT
jgi:hypothetical protein